MDATDPVNLGRESIHRMTPAERFRRCCELYEFMHRVVSFQVVKDDRSCSPDELRWQVAQRMYSTDRTAQRLLALAKDSTRRERP